VPAPARRQAYSQHFIDAYREGVREGRLRPADPTIAVNATLAAANSISAWYHSGSSEAPGPIGEFVAAVLLSGVTPEPGNGRGSKAKKAKKRRSS
jgi:hypothetical protein